ncbi:MAG: type II toxin-antitoxin system Phd/YefM family antitoxin [Lachnospiraceae bacterium]|jgi:antitoxin Phd|nr:type II toxin-antitoxin system Phd/YefM family antitoxin [Lachnospiraceae bacterium]
MIIDTDKTVSMTEANQNFSKVARMAMEYGDVTILKNNKVFLTVHYEPQDNSVKAASDEDVLAASAKLMKRNKHVYEELAK